jgi:hypothetical protein
MSDELLPVEFVFLYVLRLLVICSLTTLMKITVTNLFDDNYLVLFLTNFQFPFLVGQFSNTVFLLDVNNR